MKRSIVILFLVLVAHGLRAQKTKFHLIPERDVEVLALPGKKARVVNVDAVEISDLITYKAYKEYLAAVKKDSSAAYYKTQLPDSGMVPKTVYEKYISSTAYDKHPVMGISWDNALNYCRWITVKENAGDSTRFIYRLPLVTEWVSAYEHYQQKGMKHDLNKKYADWTLNAKDEGYVDQDGTEVPSWNLYFALKNDPPALKRKMVIGDSYLYTFERLWDHLLLSYYEYEGYRHIGFRLVKEQVQGLPKPSRYNKHLTVRILESWGIKK